MANKNRAASRRIPKWSWVLLPVMAMAWMLWFAIPMSESQKERNKVSVEYRSCYALTSGSDTLLYIDELSNDWTRANISVDNEILASREETFGGAWHNKFLFFPSCHGRIVTYNPDYKADSLLRIVNDTLPKLVRQQQIMLAEKSKTLERTLRELLYYMRVHSVADDGYHIVAAHYAEVTADKERVDAALKSLHGIGNKPLRMSIVQRFTAVYKNERGKMRRRRCHLLKSDAPSLRCIIQTRNRLKPIYAYANYNSEPSEYTGKPQAKYAYYGETKDGKRNGHGIYIDSAGNYYDGFWTDGMREGFGCSVDSAGNVRVGLWKDDRFRGERLNYTPERVYGIDIARYQHEVDKGIYPINWKNLHITSLGVKTPKTITGKVNYPVSFVFIKSTEGTSVLNKYYGSDYVAARKNGIHVGTYHFFSTKSDPIKQAKHFLRNSKFGKGDLPPVLDVEPGDAQIAAMGGAEVMFSYIRTWMNIVESATGTRPILYINQMFVNQYMPLAPDIAADYEVWIARYNEFKPDMHLAFWQLGYDGKLSGIRGDVDINVFNGYRDEWEEYLERRTIR